MSTYRYVSTDIVTGKLLMADIPVTVSSFNTQLNGTGHLSGSLVLRTDMSIDYQNQALNAIEPWKAMFWVFCDDIPVWGGPVTSLTSQSAQTMTLSFTASTVDAILQFRIYDQNVDFEGQDVGLIFYETLNYVLNKHLPNSRIANLNYANKGIHVKDATFSITGSNFQDVQSIWNSLVTACDVEYYFQPSWNGSSSAPMLSLVLGQTVGRPLSATNLNLVYPSKTVVDYSYIQQANQPANHVIATGITSVTVYTGGTPVTGYISDSSSGYDQASLNAGHTLLEVSYAAPNAVTSQADINAIANTQVKTLTPISQATPGIVLGAGQYPRPYEVQLGDWVSFSATSPLQPPKSTGGPGLVITGRISNIEVIPAAANQVESMTLTLGQINRTV